MRRTPGLLLLVIALGACGGSLSVEEAFDGALDSACEKAFECRSSYPGGETQFVSFYGNSEADCRARLGALIDLQVAEVEASVEAGRIEYDAGDAEECLDAYADLTCEEAWSTDGQEESAACENAFRGTVPDGGQCTNDMDCAADGSDCDDGVCTAF